IIKDSFVALEGELEAAANASDDREFKRMLKDSRGLTKDFREESHRVLGAEGEIGAARTRVNEALDGDKDYLQTLLDNIRQSRKDSELEILDEANEGIQERIVHIKEKGRDVAELQAKLDEMKEERDALKEKLEAAIASCEGAGVGDCDTAEAQEYRALKDDIKDGYKELRTTSKKTGQTHRISNAIKASRKVLERLETRISQAEARGVDVTAAKAKFDRITEMLDSAEAKYNEGDYEGALAELKNAKEALKGSGIKKAIERKSGAIEKVKERREGALDEAEERRKVALENAEERRKNAIDEAEERRKVALENAEERREEVIRR
ncbi:MAG: hypothetical protein V3R93_02040, partial [Candidatus Hydrothermarchaeaceae archaeon]